MTHIIKLRICDKRVRSFMMSKLFGKIFENLLTNVYTDDIMCILNIYNIAILEIDHGYYHQQFFGRAYL